jgi:alpha-N-arabinofuranosidase
MWMAVTGLIGLLGALPAMTVDADEPLTAEIRIEADTVIGPVPPFVSGNNIVATDGYPAWGPQREPFYGQTGDGIWNPNTRQPVPELVAVARETGVRLMRYPGGCNVHGFDWKKAVGPVVQRPDHPFGLDEFLTTCHAIGAEPLITVSDFTGSPQDAADLVEYLNAPANRRHPWARQRAAGGHPEPYGVVWFELGNETYHGNHALKPARSYTPETYAAWVVDCARRMRRADRRIKLGAILAPDYWYPWNPVLLETAGQYLDFVVAHTYALDIWSDRELPQDRAAMMRACLAAGEQCEQRLREQRGLILKHTRRNLPLAVTEYNAGIYHYKPPLYRYSLGAALFSADYMRILLQPDLNVALANYWHFVNGSFGMVLGPPVPGESPAEWRKMPAYYLFRLWGRHFGTRLVKTTVAGPEVEFEGCLNVRPARANFPEQALPVTLGTGTEKGLAWEATGEKALALTLKDFRGTAYPVLAKTEVPSQRRCCLTFEARGIGTFGPGATLGLSVLDSRGWSATHSGAGAEGIEKAGSWQRFRAVLETKPGCTGVVLHGYLSATNKAVSARIEVRNLDLRLLREFGPYQALTACASRSGKGDTLYVVVFNKHPSADIEATLQVAGSPVSSGRWWRVSGPSLEATNLDQEQVKETVSNAPVPAPVSGRIPHTFPRLSMTAFEFRLTGARKEGAGD